MATRIKKYHRDPGTGEIYGATLKPKATRKQAKRDDIKKLFSKFYKRHGVMLPHFYESQRKLAADLEKRIRSLVARRERKAFDAGWTGNNVCRSWAEVGEDDKALNVDESWEAYRRGMKP